MRNNEQGFALIDVLAAMAIIGIVGISVWQAQSAAHATLVNAKNRSRACIAAAEMSVLLELGEEVPPSRNFTHKVEREGAFARLEVSWDGRSNLQTLQTGPFLYNR